MCVHCSLAVLVSQVVDDHLPGLAEGHDQANKVQPPVDVATGVFQRQIVEMANEGGVNIRSRPVSFGHQAPRLGALAIGLEALGLGLATDDLAADGVRLGAEGRDVHLDVGLHVEHGGVQGGLDFRSDCGALVVPAA